MDSIDNGFELPVARPEQTATEAAMAWQEFWTHYGDMYTLEVESSTDESFQYGRQERERLNDYLSSISDSEYGFALEVLMRGGSRKVKIELAFFAHDIYEEQPGRAFITLDRLVDEPDASIHFQVVENLLYIMNDGIGMESTVHSPTTEPTSEHRDKFSDIMQKILSKYAPAQE